MGRISVSTPTGTLLPWSAVGLTPQSHADTTVPRYPTASNRQGAPALRPGTRDVANGCITHLVLLLLLRLGKRRDTDSKGARRCRGSPWWVLQIFHPPCPAFRAAPSYQSDNLISSLRGFKGSPVGQGSGGVIRLVQVLILLPTQDRKRVRDRCRAGARIKRRGGCY